MKIALPSSAAALALAVLSAHPALAQEKPIVMPSGKYTIESRDTTVKDFPLSTWPFELKGNGTFTITSPEGPTFSGVIKQDKGTVTYSDQGCTDESAKQITGTYVLKMERGGYVFDLQNDPCAKEHKTLTQWLFRKKK